MQQRKLGVVIVDDEELTRKFLRKCIDWDSLDMVIVAEASGGKEALDLIEEHSPDIVFTDIQMPFMDGIELSRQISVLYPGIKVVIVTAHKDFEYARQSVSIGVEDFLLKPINRNELMQVAQELRESIDREKQHWVEYDRIKRQLEDNRDYLKEKTLLEILEENLDRELMLSRLSYYFPDRLPTCIQVGLVSPVAPNTTYGEEDRLMLRLRVAESAKLLAARDKHLEIVYDNHYRVVLLAFEDIDLLPTCERLHVSILKATGNPVTIGISGKYDDISFTGRAYQEASDALRYGKLAAPGQITLYEEDLGLNGRKWFVPDVDLAEIGFLVKAGQNDKAYNMAKLLLDSAVGVPLDQVRIAGVNILSAIMGALADLGLTYKGDDGQAELPYHQIFACDSTVAMLKCLRQTLNHATFEIQTTRSDKSRKVVQDVQAYIQANLAMPDLTQTGVAKAFYTNPSYLSRVFKKETGVSFTEYIIKLRLERAMELLRETDLKAYQVAEAVGINDAYYFSNCFKKFTGQTVSDYKKQF